MSVKEIKPEETTRARAFELWMTSPMPMVTLVKTLDVSPLVKSARKLGLKFNMLLCWCIGKAAEKVKEFYLLPVNGKLFCYDRIAINVIVQNVNGGDKFLRHSSGRQSGAVQPGLSCAYYKFANPMLLWGKYRRRLFRTLLPLSFQFHHVQMDGGQAAMFLELLQKEILGLGKSL